MIVKWYKVKNLKKDGLYWEWKIEYETEDESLFGDTYFIDEYHTNNSGQGLWRNGRQVLGTCQYQFLPRTKSGMLRRIKREFEVDHFISQG